MENFISLLGGTPDLSGGDMASEVAKSALAKTVRIGVSCKSRLVSRPLYHPATVSSRAHDVEFGMVLLLAATLAPSPLAEASRCFHPADSRSPRYCSTRSAAVT